MSTHDDRKARVLAACAVLGISANEAAERAKKSPTFVNAVLNGRKPGLGIWEPLAAVLGCDVAWLTTGDSSRAPTWWKVSTAERHPVERDVVHEEKKTAPRDFIVDSTERQNRLPPGIFSLQNYERLAPIRPRPNKVETQSTRRGHHSLAVIGSVSAGDGQVAARWEASEGSLDFPARWVAVKITGKSAYPVAYPGQLALIDLDRAACVSTLTETVLEDLHDNLCLIQTTEGGASRAYLKRFCREPRSPLGFTLASVDSGRGSPYLPADTIDLIAPVVGVIFEDPRETRVKGRNRADVVTPGDHQ